MYNEKFLRMETTVQNYLKICHSIKDEKLLISFLDRESVKKYWSIIPEYIFARCPFCGKEQKEQIDTYSLRNWERATDGRLVFWREHSQRCIHLARTHAFINMNGIIPQISNTELIWNSDFISEAPLVYPFLFDKVKSCRAVIHSLPICRIEGDRFVPRYTLYVISYFVKWPLIARRNVTKTLREYEPSMERRCLLPYPHKGIPDVESWWDMTKYVKEKKLLWIKPDDEKFSLMREVNQFPYGNIEGRRFPYIMAYPEEPPVRAIGRML